MQDDNFMAMFGVMAGSFGNGGDADSVFPVSDTMDFTNGAKYIPGKVTDARRKGETVTFSPHAQEWTFADGSTIK